MSVIGIIKDATIVTLRDIEDETGRKPRFLYGTIVSDAQQRFNAGNWFLSSVILDIVENKVETRNSIYLVRGVCCDIEMTLDEFSYVRQGHEPLTAMKLAHDDSFKTQHTVQNHLSVQNKKELDKFLSFLK